MSSCPLVENPAGIPPLAAMDAAEVEASHRVQPAMDAAAQEDNLLAAVGWLGQVANWTLAGSPFLSGFQSPEPAGRCPVVARQVVAG